MKISAVIFELDGTVIANEGEYGEAFSRVLRRLGVEDDFTYPHVEGIGIEENWNIFIKKYNIKTNKTLGELATETQNEYTKLISRITLRDGFENLVGDLRNAGIKIALTTSSTWDVVEEVFDQLGIETLFDSITTGEEVKYKKPDPEIFDKTADKLGINPEDCLVIESSVVGIEAALSAKMKVIGLARDKENKNKLSIANLAVSRLSDITPERIENLN